MTEETSRPRWTAPTIRKYGTFETTTQLGCDKTYGSTDGYTMMGVAIACAS